MLDIEKIDRLIERRTHERLQIHFEMHYGILDDLSERITDRKGELHDLSGGGLHFITDEMLPVDTQLVIDLEVPGWKIEDDDWVPTQNKDDKERLKLVGVVVWICEELLEMKYEIGVKFTGMIS